ncbi:helix-turn-helix domain-containing protein [Novosphingobium sp. JCM 18896]|uniref:helix-turn-helix domain-containing protein n=1 Tax=Novosphingobium sp. JCM 18896 TaxID=2989731 RepID=UPI0022231FDE|nr:helix-turn-helix domain-containing protein [Novosphingobium sp. JCM 18896]MCW1431631.1 helix-turn-helix domain-containing protein [Novosphingobium sp. JCM 18896]
MALPPETAAARLLKGLNERDALLKSLEAVALPLANERYFKDFLAKINGAKTGNRPNDIAATSKSALAGIGEHQLPVFLHFLSSLESSDTLRATDLARQLGQLPDEASASKTKPNVPPVANATIRSTDDLGRMIRKARKSMKLNQTEFAAHAGVGRRFISELEGGKGSLEFDKVIGCAIAAGIDLTARSRTS